MTNRTFLLSVFVVGVIPPLAACAALVRPLKRGTAAVPAAVGAPHARRSTWDGFAETDGGVSGSVIRVTSLAATGPGSLNAAVQKSGPRLIVFEVGGVIDLGGRTLAVRNPFATIAGQTAPDPGITLIRGSLVVETHDVVVQHIAVRPGDANRAFSKWAPDALGVHRGNQPVYNVVFDHCSATWSIDENLSSSGPGDAEPEATAHDVTMRSCLIAEALSHATHPKGEHSKGTLVHDSVRNVAILGCLYAHNVERNPRLKGGTRTIVAGNGMYNWASACVGVGAKGNEKMLAPAEAVVEHNTAIAGPDTRFKQFIKAVDPGGRVFARDNAVPGAVMDEKTVALSQRPSWAPETESMTAEQVLRTVGSRPAHRDPIDARIVQSVIDRTGHIIDSQEQVGGYPVRAAATRALTVPEDVEARRAWLAKLADEVTVPSPRAAGRGSG